MSDFFDKFGKMVGSFLTSRKFWSIVLGAVLHYQAKKQGWELDPDIFSNGGIGLAGMIMGEDIAKKFKSSK